MELLRALVSGISQQRPDHTYAVGGVLLPMEARMGGLFIGFLFGLLFLALLDRLRAWWLPGGWTAVVLLVGISATALDGLNAYLFDHGQFHLYAPLLSLRLATGLAAGFGIAAFALPVVAASVWEEGDRISSLDGVAELAVGFSALALIQIVIEADVALLLVPLALLQVASVIATVATADIYLLAHALGWARSHTTWRSLAPLALAAIPIAIVKLMVLAELRR